MSHSVPSDSSAADGLFAVGADLVSFDRRDLPIYSTPSAMWAGLGEDTPVYGASVDRLYGEPGEVYVASVPLIEEPRDFPVPASDPLVVLANIGDGFYAHPCEVPLALDHPMPGVHSHDATAVFDFLHVDWSADIAKTEWFYDHHV